MNLHKTLYIILHICLGCMPYVLGAQLPGMKIYTQLDGFPGTAGYHINQDEKGFMWIGTDNGAVCFDGKKFKVIDEKDGLADKEILVALPYSDNYVLLLPLLNNVAYCKNGKVITRNQDKNLDKIANTRINICFTDPVTQNAWLGDAQSNHFLYCISHDTIKKIEVKIRFPFELMRVFNNQLYLRGACGSKPFVFARYDLINHVLTELKIENKTSENYFSTHECSLWNMSEDGKYFAIGDANKHIDIFEIKKDSLKRINSVSLSQPIRALKIDRNNHLWLLLKNSGMEYWGDISKQDRMAPPVSFLNGIIANDVFVDREGHVWFTTEQKGLCFISSRHWDNAKLTLKLQLPEYTPKCVTGDSLGNIFIGHSGNPSFSFIQNGKTTVFQVPGGSPRGVRNVVRYSDKLYIVAEAIAKYYVKGKNIRFNNTLTHGGIKNITAYSATHFLAAEGTSLSLIKWDASGHNDKDFITLFNGRTTTVAVLPDSSILIGTPNGLLCKPTLKLPAMKVKNNVLARANITSIVRARKTNVLVGTNAQGLYNYNYTTGMGKPVLLASNKPFGLIQHIFKQNDSIYWISTDKGVYQVIFDWDMQIRQAVNYTFFDGLPSSNASSVYVYNDTAYIATLAGMAILPLKAHAPASAAPVLWLNQVRFDDSVIHFPPGQINLNHRQNNIQLSFSAIAYENIGNIKFLYRLNGLSDKWVETESPEISFSGLSPGNYLLEVFAVNVNGTRAVKPLLMSIIVNPAFWQTAWFRGLIILFICAAIIFCVYWFIVSEKNKQYNKIQQKKRLAELELEAIKAQINPHFVYNCLNSIQYFSYKNDFEPVKQYLDIFAKLIRQTMQYSQETFITLEEEANYLENYLKLEKVRFKDKLVYHLAVDKTLDAMARVPSMLVQPYVENAMKHGVAKLEHTGEVWVSFSRAADNGIKIIIEDNGPGIKKPATDTQRKPLGMRIAGNRASTYNQLFGLDIRVSIVPAETTQGTRVELLIPPINYGNTKL